MSDCFDGNVNENANSGLPALNFEHVDDLLRGSITEKLAECLFVISDAMLFHQVDEIRWRISCQCGFRKVRVRGEEIFGLAMQVGEVAASTARNQDLFANAPGALQHRYTSATLAGLNSAHEPSRAAPQDDDVKVLFHASPASVGREWMSNS
jgi:hypothetical protein